MEGDQSLSVEISIEVPSLVLDEDEKEVEKDDNNENAFTELAKSIFVSEKLPILLLRYLISKKEIGI